MVDTRPAGSARGAAVSYLEVERAAIAILKAGQRPSVERIRTALGRGSPQTLLAALQRFWRDLGSQIEVDPAALSRLPVEIVSLADGLWQRALALASQAAQSEDNAARERLEQRRLEVELRARTMQLREQEWEMAARAREQALADARAQASTLLGALESERLTRASRERRIETLERQLEESRQQLATLMASTRRLAAPAHRRAARPRNPPPSTPRRSSRAAAPTRRRVRPAGH